MVDNNQNAILKDNCLFISLPSYQVLILIRPLAKVFRDIMRDGLLLPILS
jgi:hypothetical protein